jgi:hypothetical protein
MNESTHLVCPNCNATNRIPAAAFTYYLWITYGTHTL